MSSQPGRPGRLGRSGRLATEEGGGCCEVDVEERLDSPRSSRLEGPTGPDTGLTALETPGNDTRYDIVRLLEAADREPCVCDAVLATRRKDGTWRYFGTTDRAEALLIALDETWGTDR